jgi:hypothetical protein
MYRHTDTSHRSFTQYITWPVRMFSLLKVSCSRIEKPPSCWELKPCHFSFAWMTRSSSRMRLVGSIMQALGCQPVHAVITWHLICTCVPIYALSWTLYNQNDDLEIWILILRFLLRNPMKGMHISTPSARDSVTDINIIPTDWHFRETPPHTDTSNSLQSTVSTWQPAANLWGGNNMDT